MSIASILFAPGCDNTPFRAGEIPMDAAVASPDLVEIPKGCEAIGCEAGKLCVAGACCDEARACGGACCDAGLICSLDTCLVPGAPCTTTAQCPPDQYCELLAEPSVSEMCGTQGHCLPRPPECMDGNTMNCVQKCKSGATATFDPIVKYSWPADVEAALPHHPYDVMMTPLVIQLENTDCDGQISAMDRSSILVTTFSDGAWNSSGVLHALSVRNGQLAEIWSKPGIFPTGALAGGNLDAKNGNEVVACGPSGASVLAFKGDGTPLWGPINVRCYNPMIADLDGDWRPEVIVEGGILDGATGQLEASFMPAPAGYFTVADLDGDHKPEVVFTNRAYDSTGKMILDLSAQLSNSNNGWVTVVDFDRDGKPEVIVTSFETNSIALWRFDANQPGNFKIIRQRFKAEVNPGGNWKFTVGMGPITGGDFDGDGVPDAGFVGFRGYVVLSGKKLMDPNLASTLDELKIWSKVTDEDNGSTGSAVFDFDGDGRVEVLYNDTQRVHIYRGGTGDDVSTPICNTTGSQFEYPVVADVDSDGQADVIVVSNAFSGNPNLIPSYVCDGKIESGVRVIGSKSNSWVQTRSIWNEHAYHVTNVNDDGSIPNVEVDNWSVPGLNNFRQNKQVGGEFGASDAVVTLLPDCTLDFGIRVVVRNLGSAPMPPGVHVNVYVDQMPEPKLVGKVTTTRALFPLQAQTLSLMIGPPDAEPLSNGEATAFGIVDEEKTLNECRIDNNRSPSTLVACAPIM